MHQMKLKTTEVPIKLTLLGNPTPYLNYQDFPSIPQENDHCYQIIIVAPEVSRVYPLAPTSAEL